MSPPEEVSRSALAWASVLSPECLLPPFFRPGEVRAIRSRLERVAGPKFVRTPARAWCGAPGDLREVKAPSDVGDSTGTEQATSAMTAAYGTTATRDLDVVVTPTRDVDVVVGAERADEIVHQLEEAGLEPSQQEFERGFTWIRGDLKVQ